MDHGGRQGGALGVAVVCPGHQTRIRDMLAVCKLALMLTSSWKLHPTGPLGPLQGVGDVEDEEVG